MERDEVQITSAKVSATNSARDWMQRLVKLGATPNEITETIEDMRKQAREEAIICLARRDEK